MALDDILTAIRAEADHGIRQIEAEAEEQITALLDEARRNAGLLEAEASHSLDRRTDREVERIINRARLTVDRRLRTTRESLYKKARAEVGERMNYVRESVGYPSLLARLLDECLAVLPEGTVVKCDPRDKAAIEVLLVERERQDVAIEPSLTTNGGVDLVGDDGRLVRNVLETRLAKSEPHLRRLAGEVLPALRGGAS